MQEKLNIMFDEWLPVVMCDGTRKNVSLYTAITEAHNIKQLQKIGDVCIEEYSIYAFIFDFVQWVYKPIGIDLEDKQEAIEDLFEKGKFNKSTLDEYIAEFEANGHSFDLFDAEHPFLQMSKEEWDTYEQSEKAKPKTFTAPEFGTGFLSGYNVVFEKGSSPLIYKEFNEGTVIAGNDVGFTSKKKIEDMVELTPVRLLASILYCLAYKHASGGGKFSSVSVKTAHPIFTVVTGNTLFETICASIGVSERYNQKPLWESDNYLVTSTDLNSNGFDNNIALTYTPTMRLYPCNYKKIYAGDFKKDKQYKPVGKDKDGKAVFNTPNKAFDKWASNYPRVLRTYTKTKDCDEKLGVVTYTHEDIWSKSPRLRTNLLQLESGSDKCDIITINYNILKKKTNLKIRYYALAYKNASSTDLINYSEIFETTKDIQPIVVRRLPEILEYIACLARTTAISIANIDYLAKTRKAITDVQLETPVSKSFEAVTEADVLIQVCMDKLEKEKNGKLSVESTEEFIQLFSELKQIFLDGFKEHMRCIPKGSLLKYAEASDNFFKQVNGIQGRFLKKYEKE